MKRIVTVQDISCLGKCSLTVALPIISAMGVETAIVPTAVLSTHTMFSGFTFHDLTEEILPIADHWQKEKLKFDAVYTGYLGSEEQIAIVAEFFDKFKTGENLVIIDPVMADNGKLYPAFDMAFAAKMAKLCGKADIILPNITEASFMTGMEYREVYDEAYIKEMLLKLAELGAKKVLLTGVGFEEGMTGVMGYDSEKKEFFRYSNKKLPVSYHGTGDIFASAFTGALMNGFSWKEAGKLAADYTAGCIRVTMEDPDGPWYGVNFEKTIGMLVEMIKK